MRNADRLKTTAALLWALAFITLGGDMTRLLASSFIRPVAITNWTADTDANRLEPGLLANLDVAICDDHFPPGSLARDQIEQGLALFEANGVNIHITYVNATQYVRHKRKSQLFSSSPSATLRIDYVDNAAGAVDPFTGIADNATFPCHPTVGDIACSSWSANTCRYSSTVGWNNKSSTLSQAAVISINPYCTAQDSAADRWTTNLDDVFNLDGVSHEMGHVVGLLHAGLRPFTSDVFQTKMIQALGQLSAYDLAFLTNYYPAAAAIANPDYSASKVLRLEQGDGTIEGGVGDFGELNPKNLYAFAGDYLSCKNAERPVYTAQFFDKSPVKGAGDVDVRFTVSTPPGTVIELHRETVPLSTATANYSQIDVTSVPLVMGTAAFGLAVAPAASLQSTLQFEIDPSHVTSEIARGNDNVAMTLNLYRERSLCPDRPRRVTADSRNVGDGFGGAIAAADHHIISGAKNHGYDASGGSFLSNAGAAWVHSVNGDWGSSTLEEKLVPTGVNARAANDLFGSAVAMTGDLATVGALAAVGAPGQDYDSNGAGATTDAGAVYLFRRSGSSWTQEAKITAPVGHRNSGDQFGAAVAISPDGSILAIGAPYHDYDVNGLSFAASAGAVFIYRYTGTSWSFSQKLVGDGFFSGFRRTGDLFGSSLALAPGKLAVGAPGQDYDSVGTGYQPDAGAVFMFSDSGTSFSIQAKLVASGTNARMAYDNFGGAVAMYQHSDDRYTLVVGAANQDYDETGAGLATDAGAAYMFTGESAGAFWMFRQKLTSESGSSDRRASDHFGRSVGVSGSRVVVGSDGQDFSADGVGYLANAGAIYLYQPVSTVEWSLVKKNGAAGAGSNARLAGDAFGGAVAISSEIFAVGVPLHGYDDSGANLVAGAGATFVYFR